MYGVGARNVFAQGWNQNCGHDGQAIFPTLAVTDDDLSMFEIDVLDAQLKGFQQTQPASVEKPAHQPIPARQIVQQGARFGARQHDGQPHRTFGVDEIAEPGELSTENHLVEEQQRREGLVLGRSAHLPRVGEARKERGDLGLCKRVGMTLP